MRWKRVQVWEHKQHADWHNSGVRDKADYEISYREDWHIFCIGLQYEKICSVVSWIFCLFYAGWFKIIVRISMAYNFLTEKNKIKLPTECESVNYRIFIWQCCTYCDSKSLLFKESKCVYFVFFFKTKSVIKMQHQHKTQFEKDPPWDNATQHWSEWFKDIASVLYWKEAGGPCILQEYVYQIQEAFHWNPQKSTRWASLEVVIPQVHNHIHAWEVQIVAGFKAR